MRKLFTLFLLIPFVQPLAAQDCSNGRYGVELFTDVDITSDVVYGNNTNLLGVPQDLMLDVYQPSGDTETDRPLVIVAHGGSFVTGSKTGADVVPLCTDLAERGYVVASINYRLGIEDLLVPANLDSVDGAEAVIRGFHDSKAAIRFFYRDVIENGNTYNIDTNNIYFGGASAGGFNALNIAYLDKMSEYPAFVDDTKASVDAGIEGNSGNAGFSSDVRAIFNIAGAIYDTNWIEAGSIPVLSLHGDQDGTVPFGTDIIVVFGTPMLPVDGSESVHARATNIGLQNCFKVQMGQDHVPHVSDADQYDTLLTMTVNYLSSFVCNLPNAFCNESGIVLSDEPLVVDQQVLDVYPNPATDRVQVTLPANTSGTTLLEMIDPSGRTVREVRTEQSGNIWVDRNGLPAGLYLLRIRNAQSVHTAKVLWE
ncbi:MAG: T9SS type A sorting domain-containing protein [Bacteroidota bacterium]